MGLCTQTDVELFGSVDFTSEPDAAVTLWINAASKAVERYCNRTLEKVTAAVEYHTGLGWHTINLGVYPVDNTTTPVAITEEGTALVNGTDFIVETETGTVRRVADGNIPRGWSVYGTIRGIVVTYDGGYADGDPVNDIPTDLRWATASAVNDIFHASQTWATAGGAESVTIDQVGSVRYPAASSAAYTSQLSANTKSLLAPFRRLYVAAGGVIA